MHANLHTKQIESIRKKLKLAQQVDRELKVFGAKGHKYILGEPASAEEVAAFEQRYSITLPSSFKAFVLQVGNGGISFADSGAGPMYGIYPLGKNVNELTSRPLEDLSAPCSLFPGMTDQEWLKMSRNIAEDDDFPEEQWDETITSIFGGILPIGSQGCSYLHGLVLNGPFRGRVVNLDLNLYKPRMTYENNFLDWYERWLDEVILGSLQANSPSWFGYSERESDPLELPSYGLWKKMWNWLVGKPF